MSGHDPRAAALAARLQELVEEALHEHLDDVLGNCPDADDAPDGTACSGFYRHLARDLAAAGLVVRPADDQYERVEWCWTDDCCGRPVLYGDDWPDNPDDRPLYVRKETNDDQ